MRGVHTMRVFPGLATAIAIVMVVAAAPSYSTPVEEQAVSTQSTHKAAIGTFGLDLSAGNPAVKPGDDFFA